MLPIDYTALDEALRRVYNQMTDLQRGGVAVGRTEGRVIFDMWVGTGKSVTCLTSMFCFKPQRILILCTKNAVPTWQVEIPKWFPEFYRPEWFVHIQAQGPDKRLKLWKAHGHYYVTTVATLLRDIEVLEKENIWFDAVITDEGQRLGLRNRKSKGFDAVSRVIYRDKYSKLVALANARQPLKFVGHLSGTLIGKATQNLWGWLHLTKRSAWPSYWKFVGNFVITIKDHFGTYYVGPKNQEMLAKMTNTILYKVDEKMAAAQLPPIHRMPLMSELPPAEHKVYDQLMEDMWAQLPNDEMVWEANKLAMFTQLRKLMCSPKLLSPSLGYGDAIETIADKIEEQDEQDHYRHNIIAAPFRDALDHYRDYLVQNYDYNPNKIIIIRGGLSTDELAQIQLRHRKDLDTTVLLTVQYAQSFSLETNRDIYFGGYDWDQDMNIQCEGRGRRTSSDRSRVISSFYINRRDCIDYELMWPALDIKTRNVKMTFKNIVQMRQEWLAKRAELKS